MAFSCTDNLADSIDNRNKYAKIKIANTELRKMEAVVICIG